MAFSTKASWKILANRETLKSTGYGGGGEVNILLVAPRQTVFA